MGDFFLLKKAFKKWQNLHGWVVSWGGGGGMLKSSDHAKIGEEGGG